MSALAFWKAVVQDESNFLERVTSLLRDGGFRYCVIGGVGVNAYAEAVLTEDLAQPPRPLRPRGNAGAESDHA